MFKRLLAIFLSLALLISAVPFISSAEETEDARIRTQIRRVYSRVRYATGRDSLNGYCGLMTGYQLWALGITPYPITFDGNDMYDYYASGDPVVTEGYVVQPYSATEYSLEEALNLITYCGTRNAYNILVGFQRTTTTAGRRYGHAMVIHAILDGTVYFVEGFYTSIGGPEGNVLTCSIKEFAEYYASWTTYEGIVLFGNKEFTNNYPNYPTDMLGEATQKANLLTLPCEAGANGCQVLRQTVPGEMFWISDIYAVDGKLYYRVQDGGNYGYLPVDAISAQQANSGSIRLDGANIPAQIQSGEALQVGGVLYSANSALETISVAVSDSNGTLVQASELTVTGRMADLSILNDFLAVSPLADGSYTVTVSAKICNYYPANGIVQNTQAQVQVWQSGLQVGSGEAAPVPEKLVDGWIWENGCWYFYQDNAPRTGWYCYEGVDYYFLPDGAAATGWHQINGHWRYFTPNGAMITGWVEYGQGMYYMLSNGAMVTGWRQIEGALYCFGQDGLMITEGAATYEGVAYTFMENGVAIAG